MALTMDIMRPEDYDDCCEALRDSLLGRTYFTNEERLQSLIGEGLEKREIRVALDQEGRFMGFIYFTFGGAFYGFPYVRVFAVKRTFRSQGVGSFLLDQFEAQSRSCSAPKVFLTVGDFNLRAKKLYESRGYLEVAKIQDLFHPGYTEHLMMKVLGDL